MLELKIACYNYKLLICALNSYFKEGKRNTEKFNALMNDRKLAFSNMLALANNATPTDKRIAGFYQTVSNITNF